jgi:hypothetical protein
MRIVIRASLLGDELLKQAPDVLRAKRNIGAGLPDLRLAVQGLRDGVSVGVAARNAFGAERAATQAILSIGAPNACARPF